MDLKLHGAEKFGTLEEYFERWLDSKAHMDVAEAIAEDAVIRLEDETTGPDGKPWEPWSDNPPGRGYASTRGPEHKLLFDTGSLADSLLAKAQGKSSVVGSDLSYALRQQFGGGNIPARPYVGVSIDIKRALDSILPSSFDLGWERFA